MLKRCCKPLFALLLATLSLNSVAGVEVDEAVTGLADLLSQVDDQKGRFEQVLVNADGETVQSSSGKFSIQQPGRFRWETLVPFAQLLVSDGKTLWLYDPDLEQVTVRNVASTDANSPMRLISGELTHLGEDYNVTLLTKEDGRQLFQLSPKLANDYFDKVTMSFVDGYLSEMLIHDLTGNVNRVHFSDVSRAQTLDPNAFTFTAPAGTDVIIDG